MSRSGDRIEATGEQASLVTGGEVVSQATPDDLVEALFARAGSDVHATDVELFVLVFRSIAWVVPDDTPGINRLLFDLWAPRLARGPCFEAYCADLPMPWRKRLLMLPLPAPKLGAVALSTLPRWSRKDQVDFRSLPARVEPELAE